MDDENSQQQPEDDGALLYWMYCEELAMGWHAIPSDSDPPPSAYSDPPPF